MIGGLRIERMLAGGEDHQCVHLKSQVNVVTRLRAARAEIHLALVADGYLAEEIHVGDDVALPQSELAELVEEAVVAVLVIAVALFLEACRSILVRDQRGARDATDRVVPAARILGNRTEN